tara:strand:- start:223 stop:402 length:180 start_codon:yes stop_codon:yes gene_type:complete
MGRSKAKKEQEIWKAVAKDMKGNKIDPRTGRVVPKKRKPPAPKPPTSPNRRSGTDYVGR